MERRTGGGGGSCGDGGTMISSEGLHHEILGNLTSTMIHSSKSKRCVIGSTLRNLYSKEFLERCYNS